MQELSLQETEERKALESKIEVGLKTYIEVGRALLIIRDKKLYRDQWGTFEEYCRERWEFRRTYAFYMIEAAQVVDSLSVHNCEHLPATESQARPLSTLPVELQSVAWKEAVSTAPDGKVTASHVAKVVEKYKPQPEASQDEIEVLADELSGEEEGYDWMPDVAAGRADSALRTFFRYPGGKSKIAGALVSEIVSLSCGGDEYREPFVGGGGVFLPVLASGKFKRIWINDYDYGIYCIWLSIHSFCPDLTERVRSFTPTVDSFYRFREILSADCRTIHPAEVAFMKIALHQMSYSGLGARAGGPIGGLGQKSKYSVGCRWSPENITNQIKAIHAAMRPLDIVVTNMDYQAMLDGENAVMYLDPPYYHQGNSLYHVGFSEHNHRVLAERLQTVKFPWLLSYDKCDDVKGLYAWANLRETEEIHYSIALKGSEQGKKSRFASEYLISGALL